MAFHDDLLEQSRQLALSDDTQAGLRRAISTAYYALFHLLVSEAVDRLSTDQAPILRARMRRAFVHADMLSVCRQISSGGISDVLRPLLILPIEPDLILLAKMFVFLQEARLNADYDLDSDVDRTVAFTAIVRARGAFAIWPSIKHTPNATTFLTALLLGRHWNR